MNGLFEAMVKHLELILNLIFKRPLQKPTFCYFEPFRGLLQIVFLLHTTITLE